MNRINRFNKDNSDEDNLQKWINERGLSEDKTINLLERALKQRKDVQLVKKCAEKIELTPTKFVSNDHIELDFSLSYKKEYLCHIYKTWKDPGYRIRRDLLLDKSIQDFKEKFVQIVEICSNNFISFEPVKKEDKDKKQTMILEIGIYEDGFNEKVLRNAVETIEEALKKIKVVLEE